MTPNQQDIPAVRHAVALLTAAIQPAVHPDGTAFALQQLPHLIEDMDNLTPDDRTTIIVTILGAFCGFVKALVRLGMPPQHITDTIHQFALTLENPT